jgi:hypothetical protein
VIFVNDGNPKSPGNGPYGAYGPQQPWMAQGPAQPWGPPQPGYGPPVAPQNPYAAPYAQPGMALPQQASPYGDSAGEHLNMQRGRYRATIYVVFAFLMQIGIVTGIFALGAGLITAVAGLNDDATAVIALGAAGTGFLGGVALAYFVFRDRWKCIEAFSSRFCSGLMNLSLLYVPVVALVYANVRGVQKLSGK